MGRHAVALAERRGADAAPAVPELCPRPRRTRTLPTPRSPCRLPRRRSGPAVTPSVVSRPTPYPRRVEETRDPRPSPSRGRAGRAGPPVPPEEAQRRFEEQLAEQKATRRRVRRRRPSEVAVRTPRAGGRARRDAGRADDGPASLSPASRPRTSTTSLNSRRADVVRADVKPIAEPGAPATQPTAGPEVDEQVDDFIYEPREVWARGGAGDVPRRGRRAGGRARPVTRSEQTTFIAVDGEQPGPTTTSPASTPACATRSRRTRLDNLHRAGAPPRRPDPAIVEPIDLDAPHVRNGVFEPAQDTFTEPEAESETAAAPTEHELAQPQVDESAAEPDVLSRSPRTPSTSVRAAARASSRSSLRPRSTSPCAARGLRAGDPALVFDASPLTPARGLRAPGARAARSAFRPPRVAARSPRFSPRTFAPRVPLASSRVRDPRPDREPQAGSGLRHPVEAPPARPGRLDPPRSLFEPLLDADEPLPALGQTRALPEPSNDQPFVPKFVPSEEPLLAARAGAGPRTDHRRPAAAAHRGRPADPRGPSHHAAASAELPGVLGLRVAEAGSLAHPRGGVPARPPPSASRRPPAAVRTALPAAGPLVALPAAGGLQPAFAVRSRLGAAEVGRSRPGRGLLGEGHADRSPLLHVQRSANFVETRADVWFRRDAESRRPLPHRQRRCG